MVTQECVFCKIIDQRLPATIIKQTSDIIVIKDIAPKYPYHYLIIPKKHIVDVAQLQEKDVLLAGNIMLMASQVAEDLPKPTAFKLVVNNGALAGQKVFHLHVHFLAGAKMSDL